MDKNKAKAIEKIKKIMALAENNPSEGEALAAALKAQRMMAEYHIEEKDLGEDITTSNIEELEVVVSGKVEKWRLMLAQVLAKNFRCKVWINSCFGAPSNVVFYGYEEDTRVCSEVYKSLYEIGKKLSDKAKREARKEWGTATGVKNSFCLGFVKGVEKELGKQCTALLVIVPKEVEESFNEKTKGFKHTSSSLANLGSYSAYAKGFETGKDAASTKKIAG